MSNPLGRASATGFIAATLLLGFSEPALAADELNSGDTAWMLTSSLLVLLMTVPGVALFYGGMVRKKNVLATLMQSFAVCCMATVIWMAVGYSLAFSGEGPFVGDLDQLFLMGIGVDSMSGTIPESVFMMFQMTFAIITPALITGAVAERIKFSSLMVFLGLWLIVVYAPVAHWVWGGGWLADMGVADFAGGLVVHMTCGVSALVLAAVLGSRSGFPREVQPPHNPGLVMMGAAMLWVGWFGFNAGSALAAGTSASMAMTVTHISAATAALTWAVIEWMRFGKPTLVGIATGTIAGLATITPASGYVGPFGGFVLGLVSGALCFAAVGFIKTKFKIDDALDVMAVHGVGGATGTFLVAFLCLPALGGLGLPVTVEGLEISLGDTVRTQLTGVVATLVWSGVATFVLVKITQALVGLRVDADTETEGLDLIAHGERGYDL